MMRRVTGEALGTLNNFRKYNVREIPVARVKNPYTRKKRTDDELIESLNKDSKKAVETKKNELLGSVVASVAEAKKDEGVKRAVGKGTYVNIFTSADTIYGFLTHIREYNMYYSKRQTVVTVTVDCGDVFSIDRTQDYLNKLRKSPSFKLETKIDDVGYKEVDCRVEEGFEFASMEYDGYHNKYKITFIKNLF